MLDTWCWRVRTPEHGRTGWTPAAEHSGPRGRSGVGGSEDGAHRRRAGRSEPGAGLHRGGGAAGAAVVWAGAHRPVAGGCPPAGRLPADGGRSRRAPLTTRPGQAWPLGRVAWTVGRTPADAATVGRTTPDRTAMD